MLIKIFRLAADIEMGKDMSTTSTDTTPSHQSIETQKWPCQVCTYLNWPRSIKCVQCYTPKREGPGPTLTDATATQTSQNQLRSSSATSLSFPQAGAETVSTAAAKVNRTTFSSSNSCNELNSSADVRSLCNSPCTVPKNLHSEQGKLSLAA